MEGLETMKAERSAEVSVIIPNFNGKKFLGDCLNSVLEQEYKDFEVILVDNGSEDGSAEWVRLEYPQVKLLALPENVGFCGGVNAGIRKARGKYILLLNNDTIAKPGFIHELVQEMEKSPAVFSCQAKMLQIQDENLMDDGGNFYCALGWAFADGKGKPEQNYNSSKKIFASCAGAALYRKSMLKKTGLLDEEHFAYLEDIDLGYRARLYGYENRFCPKARVLHVGSATSGSRYNLFKVRYSSRNNIYMIYKNMPWWQIILNLPFFLAGFGIKTIFFARKGFGKEYLAGIKNGFSISSKNRRKRVDFKGKGMQCLKIQIELYQNIFRRLCQ